MQEKPLNETLRELPPPFDAELAAARLADVLAVENAAGLKRLCRENTRVERLLLNVFAASPYLFSLVSKYPEFAAHILTSSPEAMLDEIIAAIQNDITGTSQSEAMAVLRRAKAKGALLTAFADIAGCWPVLVAAKKYSLLADALVCAAVRWLLLDEAESGNLLIYTANDPAQNCGYTILAMGKLGAGELNFSSDIDLIVLYDPENAAVKPGMDAAKIFIRITRGLVKLLAERTIDGYVFRTDLRLRPDPGATQIAISIAAAAQYYLTIGQNWERAAMIRARPLAGDIALGREFLKELQPFIWRKYLDFAAIADVHAMKRQINAHKGFGDIAVLSHNIKLGRGGIREIEFFVQTQQLIAGGRQPELRQIRTLSALKALNEAGWIEGAARDELEAAYKFLRHVEHRIQMQRDEQTHKMPVDEQGLAVLAAFCGFAGVEAFKSELLTHLQNVQRHYAALFEETPQLSGVEGSLVFVGSEDDPDTLDTLAQMGYPDPQFVSRQIRSWHAGRFPAVRSEKARERLTEIIPVLLGAFAKTADPGGAFTAFDRFLSRLPGGVQLFSLLSAQPELLRLLSDIMGSSPRLSGMLSHRPRTLEAVLDPEFFTHIPDMKGYESALSSRLQQAATFEERLDTARIFAQEHKFRIGVRLLAATLEADEAGAAYAALAGAAIRVLLREVEARMAERYGRIKGGAVAVVAMGKLGGAEMSATSDLDLILIYETDADAGPSDGARMLGAGAYYSRLTQQLISVLTVPTSEGALYEVDMRLRPSGRSGPLATGFASFSAYQKNSAWIWEKLALIRARAIAGPEKLCIKINRLIEDDLCMKRDPAMVARSVIDMRSRIETARQAQGIWDIKQARGGLVDLEFIVQYLQLVHAHAFPDILERNTSRAISALAGHDLLGSNAALIMMEAIYLYGQTSQILRLCLDGGFDPQTAPQGLISLLLRTTNAPDMKQLESQLTDTQRSVYALFCSVIGEPAG